MARDSNSDSDSHEEYYDDVENNPAVTHIVRERRNAAKGTFSGEI
jgi:hypothetical protein